MVAALDVVAAWALYSLLAARTRTGAALAAILRVVYAAAFLAAVPNLLQAARVASSSGQAASGALSAIDAFKDAWAVALVVFAAHLIVLGVLLFREPWSHWLLGGLVALSGIGYAVDGFGRLLSRGYSADVARFTFFGEVVLMIWLLWRARRDAAIPLPW